MTATSILLDPLDRLLQVGWLTFGVPLVVLLVVVNVGKDRPYPGLPVAKVTHQQWYLRLIEYCFVPGLSWMLYPQETIAVGKQVSEHTDGIYQVRASGCWKIVLPRRYADEIQNLSALSLFGSTVKDFQADKPGFEAMYEGPRRTDSLFPDSVNKLNHHLGALVEPMAEEMDYASRKLLAPAERHTHWHTLEVTQVAREIITRNVTRALAGKEFARNEQWIELACQHTISTFKAGIVISHVPVVLQRLIVWILPLCITQRRQLAQARQIMDPKVHEYLARSDKSLAYTTDHPTAFDCLRQVSKGRAPVDLTLIQMGLAQASIHTSAEVLSRVMIQICKTPDIVADLRAEIVEVLQQEGAWTRSAINRLKLLDSFMKEVSRFYPMWSASMLREIRKDVVLSNGVILPAGGHCMVEDDGKMDPAVYPEPHIFKPRRFLVDGDDLTHGFAFATKDNQIFGYGVHQCPGKTFAGVELKIILIFLLLRYDWKFEKGYGPSDLVYFESRNAIPPTRLQCRRRHEEIDLAFGRIV